MQYHRFFASNIAPIQWGKSVFLKSGFFFSILTLLLIVFSRVLVLLLVFLSTLAALWSFKQAWILWRQSKQNFKDSERHGFQSEQFEIRNGQTMSRSRGHEIIEIE